MASNHPPLPMPTDERELDRAVAEALGWRELVPDAYVNYGTGRDLCGWHPTRKDGGFYNNGRMAVPEYSSQLRCAWECVDWLRAKGWRFRLQDNGESWTGEFATLEGDGWHGIVECAETPALAIVTAFLAVCQSTIFREGGQGDAG